MIRKTSEKSEKLFIALLRSALTQTEEAIDLTDADFESLYTLAEQHDLAHIVYNELKKRTAFPNDALERKFKKQFEIAVYRHIKRELVIAQIRNALERAGIPFVLLKGAYLMDLYPEAWMRTSSDIDVLVHENDLNSAAQLFVDCGMRREHAGRYDVSFQSAEQFTVELHFSMTEGFTSARQKRIMQQVWSHCEKQVGCGAEHRMSDELFYFYHIAHMAKHFRYGGIGVRAVSDTWFLNHRLSFDREARCALLRKGELEAFERQAVLLAEAWFSGSEEAIDDSLSREFERYILHSGVFGTKERISAVKKRKHNLVRHYSRNLFLKPVLMKQKYPVLNRAPFLLPFFWVYRIGCMLLPGNAKKYVSAIQAERSADDQLGREIQTLMLKLDLW